LFNLKENGHTQTFKETLLARDSCEKSLVTVKLKISVNQVRVRMSANHMLSIT